MKIGKTSKTAYRFTVQQGERCPPDNIFDKHRKVDIY